MEETEVGVDLRRRHLAPGGRALQCSKEAGLREQQERARLVINLPLPGTEREALDHLPHLKVQMQRNGLRRHREKRLQHLKKSAVEPRLRTKKTT
jgi:hypothetical protein